MATTSNGVDYQPDIEIANRILTALINKSMTLKALTEATGITYPTLRRSIQQDRPNRRSFTVSELGKVATALNVHPSTLMPAEFASRDAA
jgi:lambda repressor-like predicted transcriptional regulator